MSESTTKFVREFSVCGPCIVAGPLAYETPKFYAYESDGRIRRKAKYMVHVEPCPSCMDHERTQYPDGYMD